MKHAGTAAHYPLNSLEDLLEDVAGGVEWAASIDPVERAAQQLNLDEFGLALEQLKGPA